MKKLFISSFLLLASCSSVQDFVKNEPIAAKASFDVSCELGKIALGALTNQNQLSQTVAQSLCDQFALGLFSASSIDLGSKELNVRYTIKDVKFENEIYQIELERIREALKSS